MILKVTTSSSYQFDGLLIKLVGNLFKERLAGTKMSSQDMVE